VIVVFSVLWVIVPDVVAMSKAALVLFERKATPPSVLVVAAVLLSVS
jgi:Holliday junction resolvase